MTNKARVPGIEVFWARGVFLLRQGTDNAELLRSSLQCADNEIRLSCRFQQFALSYRAIIEPLLQQLFQGVHFAGMMRDGSVADVVGSQVSQFTQLRKRDELTHQFAVEIG